MEQETKPRKISNNGLSRTEECFTIMFIFLFIFSLISFISGGIDANQPSWHQYRNCFESTAPIKKYNPIYLGACWLFGEKEWLKNEY